MSDYTEGTEWTLGVSDPTTRETDGGDVVDVFVWTVNSSKPCSICLSRNGTEYEAPASPTSIPNRIAVYAGVRLMKHTNCSCTLDYVERRTNDALILLNRTETSTNAEIDEVNTDVVISPGGSKTYTDSDTDGNSLTSTDTDGATVSGGLKGVTGTITSVHSDSNTDSNSSTDSSSETLNNNTEDEQYVYERWKIITTNYTDLYKDGGEKEHSYDNTKVETIFLGRVNR